MTDRRKNHMTLTNRSILITGGNSGIGLATARPALAQGARVATTGRDQVKLVAAVAELAGDVIGIQAELNDPAAIDAMVRAVTAAYGRLDAVFANAGVSGSTPLGTSTREAFDTLVSTNLTGRVHYGARRAAAPREGQRVRAERLGHGRARPSGLGRVRGDQGRHHEHGTGVRVRTLATRHPCQHRDSGRYAHADLDAWCAQWRAAGCHRGRDVAPHTVRAFRRSRRGGPGCPVPRVGGILRQTAAEIVVDGGTTGAPWGAPIFRAH